ncbi:hypothetical protein L1987_09280 [Smallanthus sonchifolius]|uniref:Uncharacterized protein n=1 Tax=Smallanthus sonchifolius TaxID=185202 RepID=A0ACB9JMH7_9ASTR|nr:hypothetical protein L1987_09280 [Smallanthus sonchifolius]
MGLFKPLKKPGTLILCFVLYSIVTDCIMFLYQVALCYEDGNPVDVKVTGEETVCCGSPNTGETKRSRFPPQSKSYTVKISCATKIPIQAIFNALQRKYSEHLHEAVRVLGVLLRQHAVKQ